ncbi:unnamed protein product [Amoebophrya sp. A25]|nr:unnamed protein product [Amoebophrya sp. A25]|eukprot:GSA25T00026673001.1
MNTGTKLVIRESLPNARPSTIRPRVDAAYQPPSSTMVTSIKEEPDAELEVDSSRSPMKGASGARSTGGRREDSASSKNASPTKSAIGGATVRFAAGAERGKQESSNQKFQQPSFADKTISEKFRAADDLPAIHDFTDRNFRLVGTREVWDALDRDEGGSISIREYIAAIRRYRYSRPNRFVLFNLINEDGGDISKEEFLEGMERLQRKAFSHRTSGFDRKDAKVPPKGSGGNTTAAEGNDSISSPASLNSLFADRTREEPEQEHTATSSNAGSKGRGPAGPASTHRRASSIKNRRGSRDSSASSSASENKAHDDHEAASERIVNREESDSGEDGADEDSRASSSFSEAASSTSSSRGGIMRAGDDGGLPVDSTVTIASSDAKSEDEQASEERGKGARATAGVEAERRRQPSLRIAASTKAMKTRLIRRESRERKTVMWAQTLNFEDFALSESDEEDGENMVFL